jgi:hypothetical protein
MSQEAAPEAIAPKRPFPVLPTYKILALGRFTAPPPPNRSRRSFRTKYPIPSSFILMENRTNVGSSRSEGAILSDECNVCDRGAHHPRAIRR